MRRFGQCWHGRCPIRFGFVLILIVECSAIIARHPQQFTMRQAALVVIVQKFAHHFVLLNDWPENFRSLSLLPQLV